MPVDPAELREVEAEGVTFQLRALPKAVARRDGEVEALLCQATELGPPDAGGRPSVVVSDRELRLSARWIISAVGQAPEHSCLPDEARRRDGRVLVGDGYEVKGQPGVFAAGDGVSGPSYVVEAMASGRAAAKSILTYLEVTDGGA
jgi:NADPH-dependent glutamate synthase beta subunit-like oxidoreductase